MAKKFSYRFESILKLKEYNTNIAKEALNYVLKIKYDKLELIEDNKVKLKSAFDFERTKMPAFLLQASANNAKFIEDEIKRIIDEINELEEIINLRRIKLTDAMKEEKIMLKLKEKKFSDYQYELNKEETAMFDEIAGRISQKPQSSRMEVI